MGSLFDWFLLATGAYVLYSGITGKGRLYKIDNVKEGMAEKLQKLLRKSYVGLGIVMMLNCGASLLKNSFYAYKELTPAAGDTAATYGWVPVKELGSFSFLTPVVLDVLVYTCLAVCMALIVYLVITMRKMTNKVDPQAAQNAARDARQANHILPVSAFEFDDDPAAPEATVTKTVTEAANDGETTVRQ